MESRLTRILERISKWYREQQGELLGVYEPVMQEGRMTIGPYEIPTGYEKPIMEGQFPQILMFVPEWAGVESDIVTMFRNRNRTYEIRVVRRFVEPQTQSSSCSIRA